jgi:hydrogenase maturation protein HypF
MAIAASLTAAAPPVARWILRVRGTVQGVGFRPFAYRMATDLGLRGSVWNDSDGVVIDAEGDPAALEALRGRLTDAPPPRARVERVEVEGVPVVGLPPFRIVRSQEQPALAARVPADLATCDACLAEMADPRDRRFGYPFINCTDCGPRYTIVRDVPYDRARTTMSAFTMCAPCAGEYEDPRSRRFHAQPNACPACGPHVWIEGGAGGDAIAAAVTALRRGALVAVKGLGGFHLACDARDASAVRALRERKRRSQKPFAVMFPDLAWVEREAVVEAAARESLRGPRRPIVLLPRRAGSALAPGVAPGLREVGAFLPYTPLHHALLLACEGPLVMTSGNLSEEPIAADNGDAVRRLAGLADVFVLHDRDIAMRADDSVVRVLLGRERVVRRARGHVPEAIALGFDGPPVLAVGADLSNALCLTTGEAAILSQHIGDLESYEAQRFWSEVRENLERLFQVRPTLVAHDLHPGYHSTAIARRLGLPTIAVQHHHAHVASCLTDNGRRDRVIGVAWDGTGFGLDGTIWGGELLLADLGGFERVGRIRAVPMAGGDAAVREPWRMALSWLIEAGLPTERVAYPRQDAIAAMIRHGVGVVATSSAGRLFDAVASLVGLRHVTTYQGQAAMELEAVADDSDDAYPLDVLEGPPLEIDPRALMRSVVSDLDRGEPVGRISGRFHAALAATIAEACRRIRERSDVSTVALSGGCFQNRLLTEQAARRLGALGFEVLLHARVPCGDGGIALGQAAVAAWRAGHVPGDSR